MNFRDLSEQEWHDLWLRQAECGDVVELPSMIDADYQRKLHGTHDKSAMLGALSFRRHVLRCVGQVSEDAKLLDFGCGWGRHLRVFLKDFHRDAMHGVDIDPDNIEICKQHLNGIHFYLSEEGKQIPIERSEIDVIISFSVFSHINESSARFWLNELARMLKPQGTLVVTSWGKALFEIAERIEKTQKIENAWERNIQRAFPNMSTVKAEYESGKYAFGRHGSPGKHLDPDVYGLGLMPRGWIEQNSSLRIVDFIEDPRIVPQTTFFLRHR